MRPFSPKYVFPIPGPVWNERVGRPASVFLLDGVCHIAPQQSPAERDLLERGAMLVATLRFDADPLEASHPERTLRALSREEAALRFAPAERN